ncbi:MAG: hypothetical protein RIR70_2241 [Pseudomonadota bacterium]|jgi:anti-sigma28 factor (negative regulator of flagellin synthesis)
MKIDDSKPGSVDVRRGTQRGGVDSRIPDSGVAPAPSAGPAANLSLGSGTNVAATVAAAGSAGASEISDVELLDKLRERIEKGDFEVDYDKLARSVLEEAIAAAGRRDE